MGGESRKRGEVGGKDFLAKKIQVWYNHLMGRSVRGPKNGRGGPKEGGEGEEIEGVRWGKWVN